MSWNPPSKNDGGGIVICVVSFGFNSSTSSSSSFIGHLRLHRRSGR